jgi:hypothetical protein
MTHKQSDLKQAYWKTVPKEKRSEVARKAAKAKHAKLSFIERSRMGVKMAKARWAKKKLISIK